MDAELHESVNEWFRLDKVWHLFVHFVKFISTNGCFIDVSQHELARMRQHAQRCINYWRMENMKRLRSDSGNCGNTSQHLCAYLVSNVSLLVDVVLSLGRLVFWFCCYISIYNIHGRVLGLRGKMEAGWSRMNDLIVIQTSQVQFFLILRASSFIGIFRDCAIMHQKPLKMLPRGVQSSAMTIDITPNTGQSLPQLHLWRRVLQCISIENLFIHLCIHSHISGDDIISFFSCRVPFSVTSLNAAVGVMITGDLACSPW